MTNSIEHVGVITHCEVCDGKTLIPVLDLGGQPLCDDLIPVGNPAEATRYPVELLACPTCVTVHQKFQVEKRILFPQTYHYRAAMTQDVLDGMAELVDLAKGRLGDLSDKVVVDIGCNDGSLLNIFKTRAGAKTTVGIEPTGAAVDAAPRVDHVINDFFGAAAVDTYLAKHPKPDIITFTNVFAHIEDLDAVISALNTLKSDKTLLIIENHYLGAVMERNQFDTFYQEHPRTYSYRSFEFIARKLGMTITHVDFPQRYNGNIRVVLQTGGEPAQCTVDESGFIDDFAAMKTYIDDYKVKIRARLEELVKEHGKLPGKAFPGRASILMTYFGIDENIISATYERTGSMKIGYYVPGTRIPIRDEAEFFANQDASPVLVNLAWHIKAEIHNFLRGKGYQGEIVELFS